MSIDEKRWKDANEAETKSWEEVLSNPNLMEQTNIFFSRHVKTMGLPDYDNGLKMRVLDTGSGPISGMLMYKNVTGVALDPIKFDQKWIDNYSAHGIEYVCMGAEEYLSNYTGEKFDSIFCYNCLLHVRDVNAIMDNFWKASDVLYFSEPIGTIRDLWHPHSFTHEWMENKLRSISIDCEFRSVNWDYEYLGGKFLLKQGGN
jgi:2-polyprenyl-3-methyl-5-hydroxy-6-metoxy-1,4-benzoquinol methylase